MTLKEVVTNVIADPSAAYAKTVDIAGELYDPMSRPALVAKTLNALGAEKLLSEEKIEYLADCTTVEGLKKFGEAAAPYLEKAKSKEGREELKSSGKEIAAPYLEQGKEIAVAKLEPYKEMATPYIQQGKELAAPYIAKLNSTKETIASDKRVQQALAGIKELKEHPRETALALKEKAVDLIKYESLESYRAYVCSDEFQESTARMLKEDLPRVVAEASARGAESLKAATTALIVEIEALKATTAEKAGPYIEKGKMAAGPYIEKGKVVAGPYIEKGKELAAPVIEKIDVAALREKAKALAAQIKEVMPDKLVDVASRLATTFKLDIIFAGDSAASSPICAPTGADMSPEKMVEGMVAESTAAAVDTASAPAPSM